MQVRHRAHRRVPTVQTRIAGSRVESSAVVAPGKPSITAQYSADLIGWTNPVSDGTNLTISAMDNFHSASPGVDKVEVNAKRTLALNGRIFVRLKVIQTP